MHLTFFGVALQQKNFTTKDSSEYIWQAQNLSANGSWYCGDMTQEINPALYNQRPPVYGAFLSLLHIDAGLENVFVLLLLQIGISLLTTFVAVQFVKLFLGEEWNRMWLLIPLLFFPTQFVYCNMVMSEILLQLFVLLAIYFIARLIKYSQMKDLWWSQWCVAIAMAIKPVMWLFPMVAVVSFLIHFFNKKVKLIALITFVIPFSTIAFFFNYSHAHTGVWEFSSIQRKLMINYNSYAILKDAFNEEEATKTISEFQSSVANLPYPEKCKQIDAFNREVLFNHPKSAIKQELTGMFNFFAGHPRWDVEKFYLGEVNVGKPYQSESRLAIFSYYAYLIACSIMGLIVLIAFVKFIFSRHISYSLRGCVASIIIYFAIVTVHSAITRFRFNVFPVLMATFCIVA
ncbi:MAG: hypothetical protein ACK5B3_06140, partial [Bacteroidota bacterium]